MTTNDMSHSQNQLNLAGQAAQKFISSKLTLLLIIGALLFGALALIQTPRTYNPEIVVPTVNIHIHRPGYNSEEMLNQIVRPLEGIMASIPGVEHTYGMAMNDSALVTVRFKVNENEETSLVKVYNQMNSNMEKMPSGTLMPLIRSISLYDVPLVTVTLHAKEVSPLALRALANEILERLRATPQVGKSWVMGASPHAIRAWLNPKKMADHKISIADIRRALGANNITLDAGTMDTRFLKTHLRVEAPLFFDKDLSNLIVGTDAAKPILLKDIATLEEGPEQNSVLSYFAERKADKLESFDLQPAVTIALARQKGSNGVSVAKTLIHQLDEMKKNNIIPENITVSITRNYGDDANDAVNTLIEHLGIAIASVVILLMIFLGWREASVEGKETKLVRNKVTDEEIAEVVSKWTGIPVAKMLEGEKEKLLHMEEALHQRVIGQNEAVDAVSNAIRRARAGLADPHRPIGSFLFLGPTGVGKTELCKALATFLFDTVDALVRIDMSEFMEKHSVARLIGAPPGYVGYEEGGYLTETIRRRPYSVILLDEIEKAHSDVFNILLQVLDDGRLTDGQGRTVDFRNTVIVMTSNIGSASIQDMSQASYNEIKTVVMEQVSHHFRPEFINRIDDSVVFHALTQAQIANIATIQVDLLKKRLMQQNIKLELLPEALEHLAEAGFDPVYGARPLKRVIQQQLENPLAQALLTGRFQPQDHILVKVEQGELQFSTK